MLISEAHTFASRTLPSLQFHPIELYPEELAVTWEEISGAFTKEFVPRLQVRAAALRCAASWLSMSAGGAARPGAGTARHAAPWGLPGRGLGSNPPLPRTSHSPPPPLPALPCSLSTLPRPLSRPPSSAPPPWAPRLRLWRPRGSPARRAVGGRWPARATRRRGGGAARRTTRTRTQRWGGAVGWAGVQVGACQGTECRGGEGRVG